MNVEIPFITKFWARFRTHAVDDNYEYTPLDRPDRQIRLLTIYPGSWNNKIECSLQVASIDDQPSYEALSYVWGDSINRKPIRVDGRTVEVTQNLFFALRRLRSTKSPRVMWVDAICINQDDKKEKSAQVAMMGTIYTCCEKATLWLGEDMDALRNAGCSSRPPMSLHARRAFELLRILGQDRHYNELPCYISTDHDHSLRVHPDFRAHFKGLGVVFDAPWFTRIWVVQEMALPGEVEFVFSSETCTYDVFRSFNAQTIKHMRNCCTDWVPGLWEDPLAYPILDDVATIQDPLVYTREAVDRGEKLSLVFLRNTFWNLDATDQRDLFYGLLGLATDWGDTKPLIPDYSLPHSTAICRAMVGIIRQNRNLTCLVGSRWLSDNDGLPSWVPDIEVNQFDFRVSQFDRRSIQMYRTTKWPVLSLFATCVLPCMKVDLINDSVLRIQSSKVATVKVVGDRVLVMTREGWDQRHLAIRQWMEMASIRNWPADPPCETSVESQFWRALIYDSVRDGLNGTLQFRRTTQDDYYNMRPFLCSIQKEETTAAIPSDYSQTHSLALAESVMFLTDSGAVGIGPAKTRRGDQVHVLPGSNFPYILRPKAAPLIGANGLIVDSYIVVGDCYLHGIMDGEAMRDMKPEDNRTKDLV
ncbi:HET-domain-containing protein [Hypoxylon crocopeplum]|nr:HET-domain-containing protein [Hypoxylon crocopeplum]